MNYLDCWVLEGKKLVINKLFRLYSFTNFHERFDINFSLNTTYMYSDVSYLIRWCVVTDNGESIIMQIAFIRFIKAQTDIYFYVISNQTCLFLNPPRPLGHNYFDLP